MKKATKLQHSKIIIIPLVLIELFVFLSSFAGAYNLMFQDAMGLPLSFLVHSGFHSYFWPGVILAVFIGGTYLLALWRTVLQDRLFPYYTATAGFALCMWIFVEMYMITQHHWLQTLYFILGLSTLILTMFSLRFMED